MQTAPTMPCSGPIEDLDIHSRRFPPTIGARLPTHLRHFTHLLEEISHDAEGSPPTKHNIHKKNPLDERVFYFSALALSVGR